MVVASRSFFTASCAWFHPRTLCYDTFMADPVVSDPVQDPEVQVPGLGDGLTMVKATVLLKLRLSVVKQTWYEFII